MRHVDEEVYRRWVRRGEPADGDIVLTREAPLGEVGILHDPAGVFLGQRLIMYRADPELADRNFLFHAMRSPTVQAQIKAFGSGSTVEHMRVPDCGELLISCPDVSTQRRIGTVLVAFDELIEINEWRIAFLEDLARSLYHEWFVRFRFPGHEGAALVNSELGLIPDGWRVYTLSDIAEPRVEGVAPGDVGVGCPYVGLEHLPRRSTTLRGWSGIESVKSRKLRFRRRDTLFGKIRPYFHKVVWAPFDGVASSDTIIMRPCEAYALPALVNATLSSDAVVAEAVATSNGTKMPRADPAVLLRYPLALPALDGHLITAFEHATSHHLELSTALVAHNHTLAATRDLLLPRLVTGRLDISDVDIGDLLSADAA